MKTSQHRQRRLGQRQREVPEHSEVVRAVDCRGVEHFLRLLAEELAQQKIENASPVQKAR